MVDMLAHLTDSRDSADHILVGITGLRFSCAATMAGASSAHKSTPRQLLALVRQPTRPSETMLEPQVDDPKPAAAHNQPRSKKQCGDRVGRGAKERDCDRESA
jgi:hypothetical protein